jgi:hypothetical protein
MFEPVNQPCWSTSTTYFDSCPEHNVATARPSFSISSEVVADPHSRMSLRAKTYKLVVIFQQPNLTGPSKFHLGYVSAQCVQRGLPCAPPQSLLH